MSLAHWLRRAAQAHPERPALAQGPFRYADYAGFARSAGGLAQHLRRVGVRRGSAVAVFSGPNPGFFEAAFGALWAGCAVAPIDPDCDGETFARRVAHSGARICFVDERRAGLATRHAPRGLSQIVMFGQHAYDAARASEPRDPAPVAAHDPAWLLYGPPSPSETAPRAATLTHRGLMSMVQTLLAEADQIEPGDAQLHMGSVAGASGLCAFHVVARAGLTVCPDGGAFDPAETFELAETWRRASLLVEPDELESLRASPVSVDPSAFRSILYARPPANPAALGGAIDRFGPRLSLVYGTSAAPLSVSRLSRHDVAAREDPRWARKAASIGRAPLSMEVQVVGSTGEPLASERPGELRLRGPARMIGYWRDRGASEAAFAGKWLRTGLRASIDDGGWITLRPPLEAGAALAAVSDRRGAAGIGATGIGLEGGADRPVARASAGARSGDGRAERSASPPV